MRPTHKPVMSTVDWSLCDLTNVLNVRPTYRSWRQVVIRDVRWLLILVTVPNADFARRFLSILANKTKERHLQSIARKLSEVVVIRINNKNKTSNHVHPF
jgi:hypothetical protein